ncbi:MAG: histidine kinase [Planctomycetaceae bacterium]|nr:histidine kinase [Planctomycetaceae bacterium]
MSRHITTSNIRQFILESVADHDSDLAAHVASTLGISRQAVNKHLKSLVEDNQLVADGKTRSRRYSLKPTHEAHLVLLNDGTLQEDVPWTEQLRPLLNDLPRNVFEILQYGLTEMLNNAIDHSESRDISIAMLRTALAVQLQVMDSGIGIFRKIKNAMNLESELQAICELSKGKLTTDPTRHSGEGIFFTSRMFDEFRILSGSLFFSHSQPNNDWLMECSTTSSIKGTSVNMILSVTSTREFKTVFDQFASPENDFKFSRTHVPVKLVQYGSDALVSRSQAKRLLKRFDMFEEVWLDFAGISMIGQGFADEVFRVYAKEHPHIKFVPINASPQVAGMISHALSNSII